MQDNLDTFFQKKCEQILLHLFWTSAFMVTVAVSGNQV